MASRLEQRTHIVGRPNGAGRAAKSHRTISTPADQRRHMFNAPVAELLAVPPPQPLPDQFGARGVIRRKIDEATFRVVDIVIASMLLLLLSPVMISCSLLVMRSSAGPILFSHRRIGKGGQEFGCLKFRTMVDGAEAMLAPIIAECGRSGSEWAATQKLSNDPRVTAIGRILRRYSLDELPQLLNVLRGEMSIVGPRPIVTDEIPRFDGFFRDYCSVKPGMTGLWQVSGRHCLAYEERVRLDAQYARSKSLWTDLVILWRTIPVVFLGRGC